MGLKEWAKRKTYVNRLRVAVLPEQVELKTAEPVGKAKYGVRYQTRIGKLKLIKRLDVEPILAEINDPFDELPLGVQYYEADLRVLPQVKDAMLLWAGLIHSAQLEYASRNGIPASKVEFFQFHVNSAFRPVGETAGWGDYRDECGALDSHDGHGHWKGTALDIKRTSSMSKCHPSVSAKTFYKAMRKAGFDRPFKGDGEDWHFRFVCDIIKED